MIDYDLLVSRLSNVEKFSKYVSALCVFHQDNQPSMLVFRDGWFRCLGCGRNGNLLTLWNKIQGQPIHIQPERRTFFSAPPLGGNLEELCYQAHEDLLNFESFGWYLEMRGLEGRIEVNEIGYLPGWYSFPVRDAEGAFQTAVFRAAPHVQAATGMRYWCKASPVPYVPDWRLLFKSSHMFVVFGLLDALTLSDLRLPVMTSTSGMSSVNPEWLNDYRKPIYIIPDAGEEEEASRLANSLGWRGKVLKLQYPPGKKDPNGFFEIGRREELLKQIESLVAEKEARHD